MSSKIFLLFFVVLATIFSAFAQQVGTNQAENHPRISIQSCTGTGSCMTEQSSVVIDANWRWLHKTNDYVNCYTGTTWNPTYCSDPVACANNCALDGADYLGTYGISSSGSSTTLGFKTGTNIGSRTYLMDAQDSKYKLFHMKNREITFDVDASLLPCGLNGAVYFVEMPGDGGMATQPTNKAGAKYGTGYCDAQCPNDVKFINGEANVVSGTDFSKGGFYGSCCVEFDLWEANSISSAYTNHVCGGAKGAHRCSGSDCNTYCDKAGCDHNPYRAGNYNFYGPGPSFTIDSSQPITVITQFLTANNSDTGALIEVKRFFKQNGRVINNPDLKFGAPPGLNSLTDNYCAAESSIFGDPNGNIAKGGFKAMGDAFDNGMVLVLSLWDDTAVSMLWLDSNYPTTANPTAPGVARGSCPTTSGKPADVEAQFPNANVKYSNFKYGTIGSTF